MALGADLLALWLTWAPGVAAYALTAWFVAALWGTLAAGAVLLAPAVLVGSFLAIVALIRLLLPKLKRGGYTVGKDKMVVVWYCHLALSRSAAAVGLLPLIHTLYVTRCLYYRALGAKLGLTTNMSMGAAIVDCQLVSVGAGATLSEGAFICGHSFSGEKLLLNTVEIGDNAYVGAQALIGAGAKIGEGARVGMHNMVYATRIEPGRVLEDFAWQQGNLAKPKG
jgi:acetyltransferase-like isoleucine patch superfamily enzyme